MNVFGKLKAVFGVEDYEDYEELEPVENIDEEELEPVETETIRSSVRAQRSAPATIFLRLWCSSR